MKTLLFTFSLSIILFSCSSEKKQEKPEETAKDRTEKEITSKEGKWKINDTLVMHVKKMESTVTSFHEKELEKYHILSDTLTAQINAMVNSCRMKGPGHDELHRWLHPFMKMKNKLGETSNLDTAIDIHQQMKLAFVEFRKKFE